MLRLRNDVRLDGTQNGEGIHVDAGAAELDRTAQLLRCTTAFDCERQHVFGATGWVFALAKDGGIQAVDAQGIVHLQGDGGMQAAAPHMHITMSATGKPQLAVMSGGVRLKDDENTASAGDAQGPVQRRGPAADGRVAASGAGGRARVRTARRAIR